MASISAASIYNPDDPYEMLISQIIQIERQPQATLRSERDNQKRLKNVMSDVDSKISALHTLVKDFKDTFNSPFRGRSASVPQNDAFSVAAGDTAAYGSHTLKVDRLASADTRISKQYASAGNTLAAVFASPQTFTIQVAKPTESDPNNLVDIEVTVDAEGTTDAEILKEISAAINQAMDDAVDAGTLTTADKAVASVVNETSGTARLSLRSGKTGFENRLRFADSAGGLLAALEVDQTTTPGSATSGGAIVAVGTDETDSGLNSRFTLDGLTLYRGSNNVSDALDGLTLTLKKVDPAPYEFSVSADASGIKGKVNDFIKKYNDLLSYLQMKSSVDGATGARGDFAGDETFRALRGNLRDDLARSVSGQPAGSPAALSDLGIEIGRDGTLSLKDEQKLLDAVEKDAGAVESLFAADDGTTGTAADGIATRLMARLEQFVGTNGIIKGRQKSIDDRVLRLDSRIKDYDERLLQREDQLRMEFAKMQETITLLRGQQQYMSNFLMF